MEVFTCAQGTPEWFAARLGIPTASEFATVMAKGKDGGVSLTRRTYLYKLAGEKITGLPAENYSNGDMRRGQAMEEEARELYAMLHDAELEPVGFIRSGARGCSPDALVGQDGGVEIKTKFPHLLIELLLRDEFPPEHRAQVQGTLLITGRDWWDLGVYWPKLPLFVKRVTPDRAYIANLSGEIDRFNDDLAALVERIQRYGNPQPVAA